MIGIILVHENNISARSLHPCEALLPTARIVGHIDYSNPEGAVVELGYMQQQLLYEY
jgi:hypothetical protein